MSVSFALVWKCREFEENMNLHNYAVSSLLELSYFVCWFGNSSNSEIEKYGKNNSLIGYYEIKQYLKGNAAAQTEICQV